MTISLIEFADWVRKCSSDGMERGLGRLDVILVLQKQAAELLIQELLVKGKK